MQYLLLIYTSENTPPDPATLKEYGELNASLKESKKWLGGERLKPTTTATSVRVRDGKTLATDGPFAETREALGGFFLIDAKDLDEAIKIAARIPASRSGTIEVRPIHAM